MTEQLRYNDFDRGPEGGVSRVEIPALVSGWIQVEADLGNMLPRSAEEIEREINSGLGMVWLNGASEPVAYCRLLPWEEDGQVRFIELGSLVADPGKRRRRHGTLAALATIAHAGQKFPGALIFCLAENQISLNLFEKIGGRIMPREKLPKEVWGLCPTCGHFGSFPDCPCVAFDLTHLAKERK